MHKDFLGAIKAYGYGTMTKEIVNVYQRHDANKRVHFGGYTIIWYIFLFLFLLRAQCLQII